MNTPPREAIQREIGTGKELRAASATEKSVESSPKLEFHGTPPQPASQAPFQAETRSAPEGQEVSEKGQGAFGTAGAPARFLGHPLPTTRSGGREIATARGNDKPKGKKGAGRKLTERDKELAGFLGITRYLSREQIERLMFPGRVKSRSSTRLGQLTKEVEGQPAILKEIGYATNEGWTNVFALTGYGYLVAQERLGKKLLKVPRHDVSPQFLKHSILLSEFFLGLVPQDGKHPAKIPQNFRWMLGEYLDLPFSEYTLEDRNQRRRLQPDAVLEIASLRARFFIEIETGSATIWDQEKLTSTLAKLNRYSEFLTGYAGNVHHGDTSTFYSRAFPDAWPAEVLFVTLSAHRRDSIHAAQKKWKADGGAEDILVRSMTVQEASRALYKKIHGCSPGAEPPHCLGTKPSTGTKEVPDAATTEQEEQLRPGRVSVRGEQLIRLEAFLRTAQEAMVALKRQLVAAKLPVPRVPDISELGATWQIYAARARRALAAFGITESV